MQPVYPIDPALSELHDTVLENFVCQGSGNCCRAPGFVYVTDEELKEMALLKSMTVEVFKLAYTELHKGWRVIASPTFRPNCFLCAENKCEVYEARPSSCRSFPKWGSIWATESSFFAEVNSCPGLKLAYKKALQK